MKPILAVIARIIYIVLYPIFGIYLHNSRRNRVLLIHEDKILLIRSYTGNQKWSLPGGGIKKNENPLKAALRELYEETGIKVSESKTVCIGEDRLPANRLWPRYAVIFYKSEIQQLVQPKVIRPWEVIEARWFDIKKLPKNLSDKVKIALNFSNK